MKKIVKIIIGFLILVILAAVFYIYKHQSKTVDVAVHENIILSQQTNGVDNSKLAQIAKQYMQSLEKDKDVRMILIGSQTDWFDSHAPESIDFNHNSNGLYQIYWRFMPGCEKKKIESKNESIWERSDGVVCLGGTAVVVFIDKDLKPQNINIGFLQ